MAFFFSMAADETSNAIWSQLSQVKKNYFFLPTSYQVKKNYFFKMTMENILLDQKLTNHYNVKCV